MNAIKLLTAMVAATAVTASTAGETDSTGVGLLGPGAEAFIKMAGIGDCPCAFACDDPSDEIFMRVAEQQLITTNVIEYASTLIGRPYRRGAKGPSAFDCSGFTSYVFSRFDTRLDASSRSQYLQGEAVERDEILPGDLIFFSGRRSGKTVGHVGIAVDVDSEGRVTFIHAATSGGVRLDRYPDGGYYSRRFIGARRVPINNQ